jgi:magnesium chelatase subunit I
MTEIVAEISQLARRSPHVNQSSGVSARLSITNYETLVANAARRALAHGEREVVPRVSDLDALVASTSGKIEIETLEDGREQQVLERIVKAAILEVFRARVKPERLGPIVASFEDGSVVHTGEDMPAAQYRDLLAQLESETVHRIPRSYRVAVSAIHAPSRPGSTLFACAAVAKSVRPGGLVILSCITKVDAC